MELVGESQSKITKLTHKYNDLCKASGLKPKKQRMSVSGYVRTKVDSIKETIKPVKLTDAELDDEFYMLTKDLEEKQIIIDNSIFNLEDKELRNKQLGHLDELTNEYKHNMITRKILKLDSEDIGRSYGETLGGLHKIRLNKKYFNNEEYLVQREKRDAELNWSYKVNEDNIPVYTLTHEYGHILEFEYIKDIKNKSAKYIKGTSIDSDLKNTLVDIARKKLDKKITITEFKNQYWGDYAKSRRNYEWFAETFAKYKLGEKDVWIETFGEWLEGYFNGK